MFTRVPESQAANRECSEVHEEDMSIPGNVLDFQPARRDPDEMHNTSKNLATSSGILRKEGIEKNGSEEPLQSIPLPCFQERAMEKSLDDRNCIMSMTNYATGIGTCTQSGMTIPSYPSSEMHLENSPDHTELQSWIVNFRTEVCLKAKKPCSHYSGSRKSKWQNRWMTSSLRSP